jgi:hypothetical protein
MATTRIISMHARSGQSVGQALGLRTDYVKNDEKTEDGKYVSSYECDPVTVNEEFLHVRQEYDKDHSRSLHKSDVIAYQIRQSFAPGEIDPGNANRLGYELAIRFTKGKHQFIVATHTDKKHIHNHIVFNSVTLDGARKFRDFLGTGRAVRKISDIICLENNLSVIQNPKKGNHTYGKWLGEHKKLSNRDYIKIAIDNALRDNPKSLKECLRILSDKYNIEVDDSGKHIKFRAEGQKKYARISSLGKGYSASDIESKIRGEYKEQGPELKNFNKKTREEKLGLLIDVQKKIREGKGLGYEKWARTFNMKQTAKTLSFLSDLGIDSYKKLFDKHEALFKKYDNLRLLIKKYDVKMEEIRTLQGAIVTYVKTNEAYQKYKASGYNKRVKEEYYEEIMDHEEARKHFKKYEGGKVPKIKELKEDYAKLKEEKAALLKDYYVMKREYTELAVAKKNIDTILDRDHDGQHDFLEKDNHEKSK